jgi:mRNA (2'-O-methyladenosine-N6-)-methyltransferase
MAEEPGAPEAAEAALVTGDAAAAAARWAALDDDALDAEIGHYRGALAAAAARLARLGALPASDSDDDFNGLVDAAADSGGAAAPAGAYNPDGMDLDGAHDAGANQAATTAAPRAPEVNELGVEGVDWRLDDLAGVDPAEWAVPPHCVPVHANVTTYDWSRLIAAAAPRGFDVVMMDPPWQLATANPTRGVALGYAQLTDGDIAALPVPALQPRGGWLLLWVINAKWQLCLDLLEKWGYELEDHVAWRKLTVNRRTANSHGFYLQHAKEVCLVARRRVAAGAAGEADEEAAASAAGGVACSVINAERRGQSQKPEEAYRLAEALAPRGRYLEVFGRKNNLRDGWVTVGNEVTGKGPPREDAAALAAGAARAPGAVFGAAPSRPGGGGGGG